MTERQRGSTGAAVYPHPKGVAAQSDGSGAAPGRGPAWPAAAPAGALRIPEEIRIRHRPEEIEERLLPRHWESGFIQGAFNRSAVGTLVERKSRFVVLCKMEDCGAEAALESCARQMKRLPAFLRQSLT